jgi:hypothetical protein
MLRQIASMFFLSVAHFSLFEDGLFYRNVVFKRQVLRA